MAAVPISLTSLDYRARLGKRFRVEGNVKTFLSELETYRCKLADGQDTPQMIPSSSDVGVPEAPALKVKTIERKAAAGDSHLQAQLTT